jgi:hypothetical protein
VPKLRAATLAISKKQAGLNEIINALFRLDIPINKMLQAFALYFFYGFSIAGESDLLPLYENICKIFLNVIISHIKFMIDQQ